MASKKKISTDSYLSVKNIGEVSEEILSLEVKNLKRWQKKPAIKRGEDLQKIIETKFPEIGDDALNLSMWVDLYIYVQNLLSCGDDFFVFMDIDEAVEALKVYENENPEQFEYLSEWVGDFGCLLTEGIGSDIGGWFHDWIADTIITVGACEYRDSLYLDNPTKAELTKLAKSKVARDRVLAALCTETSGDILTSLAQDHATVVRFAVANNPSTPEAELDKLSRDPEEPVRQAALSNESISAESLESTDSDEGKLGLASSKKATAESLAKLVKEKDEEIRSAVAENENASLETLLLLAKDKSDDVREKVADNPKSPVEAIRILARDKDSFVRGSLAFREDLTDEIFKLLSKDKDVWVRQNIAGNQSTPVEILTKLSKDPDSSVRDAALRNANLGDETVASFENPIAVKLRLAGNPNTPLDILETMCSDMEPIYYEGQTSSLSAAVAGNLSISESLMENLMKSKDNQVIQALASNTSLSPKYMDELVKNSLKKGKAGKWSWENRHLELGLASNPHSPSGYLIELVGHGDSWALAEVATNPSLPLKQIAILGKNHDENIRRCVAANPKAPWALLQSLMKDKSCIWNIAQNPGTRPEELQEIAAVKETGGPNPLSDIAKNPSTPIALLEKLAKHKDGWVRLGVADNVSTPDAVRKKILDGFLALKSAENEGDDHVARCKFASSEMLDSLLERYSPLESMHRSIIVCHIARNPNASAEVLTRLARDRFSDVRIAVAGNPNTPVDVLRELNK